jgi:hypothetical protein
VTALALAGGGAAVAATWTSGPQDAAVVRAAVPADDTVAALAFNREEERMARDVYTLFGDTYDDGPFARIAVSEQQHFAAVGSLLATYGIDDPSAGLEAGEYADPAVQELYDTWKAQGLESFDAALQVGVELEERDIADLEATLDRVDQADVQWVLSRLLAGSRMHLRAFTAWVEGDVADGDWGGMGPGGMSPWGGGGGMGPGYGGGWDEDSDRGWNGSGRGGCPWGRSGW